MRAKELNLMTETKDNSENARLEHAETRAFVSRANEAAVEISITTLKSLILINGGAAVAMLGFVASISTGDRGTGLDMAAVVYVLQLFSLGAGMAVLSSGLAYVVMYLQAAIAQLADRNQEPPYISANAKTLTLSRVYSLTHILSVLAALLSWGLFICGVYSTAGIVQSASLP